jgi:hypothetical protein
VELMAFAVPQVLRIWRTREPASEGLDQAVWRPGAVLGLRLGIGRVFGGWSATLIRRGPSHDTLTLAVRIAG